MGLSLSGGFLLMVVFHCSYQKLVYLNGVQQKDLTPVNPNDVDAVISGLQMYAQVVRRDANSALEVLKSMNTSDQQQNYTTEEKSEASMIHAPTNTLRLSNDAPKFVSNITYELPVVQRHDEIKLGKGISTGTNVLESIQSLLGILMTNSSNSGLFITNFASVHFHETDE